MLRQGKRRRFRYDRVSSSWTHHARLMQLVDNLLDRCMRVHLTGSHGLSRYPNFIPNILLLENSRQEALFQQGKDVFFSLVSSTLSELRMGSAELSEGGNRVD